ncbi:DNA internalization-related competence protein ComEC/Rec2 [Shouchella sp. JSM 1781072]|uniref:DNA internalization-related competence protein ComEC/Rec2 n=1 Tax=Shouchella sp. JSM 1781072 TaxID=3344581 RepID=UPI0035C1AB5A
MSAILFVLQSSLILAFVFFISGFVLSSFHFLKGERTTIWYLLIPFILYFLSTSYIHQKNASTLTPGPTELTFQLLDGVYIDGNQLKTTIQTADHEKLMLTAYSQTEEALTNWTAKAGDICQAKGDLKRPMEARNHYAFDYQQFLYYQRIHYLFDVKQLQFIECTTNTGISFLYQLNQYRHHVMSLLRERLPPSISGIVIALTLGERYYMDPLVSDAYSKLGVIHLLAISGLHVGIVTGTYFYVMIRIGVPRELVILSIFVLLPFFIFLTGASPPVVRAAVMTMIYFLLLFLRVPIHPFYGFSAIFLLYLFFQPYALFQLGFQLSFLVSFTLLLVQNTIMNRVHSYMGRLFYVTTIAQLIGLPLIAFHFYEWSPFSLIINLIYIPFVSLFLLPYSFLLVFINGFSIHAVQLFSFFPAIVMEWLHKWIVALADYVYVFVIGRPHVLIVLCLYSLLILSGLLWERRSRWLYLSLGLFSVCLMLPSQLPKWNEQAVVTMLDVGQGDSMIIETPYRKEVYIIDTGGVVSFATEDWQQKKKTFDTGKDIVVPYMKAKGIKKIDGLILTHGDYDHVGGAEAVLNELQVEQVYLPYGELEKEIDYHLVEIIDDAKLTFVQAGDTISDQFYVLHPTADKSWSGNDKSIVLYTSFYDTSLLLTGDLEKEGEDDLKQRYPQMSVDLLKVGHHGSQTSTQPHFLEQLSPQLAFISAGVNNRFGHPHPDVLDRLHASGVDVYQTNLHATVEIVINENRIDVFPTQSQ